MHGTHLNYVYIYVIMWSDDLIVWNAEFIFWENIKPLILMKQNIVQFMLLVTDQNKVILNKMFNLF